MIPWAKNPMLVLPDAIEILEQDKAQSWMERLFNDPVLQTDFKKVFQGEAQNSGAKALQPEQRLYFLILAAGTPELIAGIHPPSNGISSMLKLLPKERSKTCGRDCIRKLIEEVIVPKCRSAGQPCFSANAFASDDGRKVFRWLAANLPNGVVTVTTSMPGVFQFWLVSPQSLWS
jgi:hypothetical protein